MDNVNKTLYIPLYGKSYVSKKGVILSDKKAELIWEKEQFPLNHQSTSKWLAYYMGMRACVFDEWVKSKMAENPNSAVLHIGCGMDSRVERVGTYSVKWYDVDFPEVIKERKKYYNETESYQMISSDARKTWWFNGVESEHAIVIMEGISMYFMPQELISFFKSLTQHFASVNILVDCYSEMSAKLSKYRNPINDVGVSKVYGIDDPHFLEKNTGLNFVKEHSITPKFLIDMLEKSEKVLFSLLYSGKIAQSMYHLYEYATTPNK